MKSRLILTTVIVAALSTVAYVMIQKERAVKNNEVSSSPMPPTKVATPEVTPEPTSTKEPAPQPLPTPKVESATQTILQIGELSAREQMRIVEEYSETTDLSAEQVKAFRDLLRKGEIYVVARNNIASMLLKQQKVDPFLYSDFSEMYADTSNEYAWRDYCVQFMGQLIPYTHGESQIQEELLEIAETDKTDIAGTALVQLALHDEYNPPEVKQRVRESVRKKLEVSSTLPASQLLSIIALVGTLEDKSQLSELRKHALSKDEDIQRTAIASLGLIGEKDDITLIQRVMSSSKSKPVQMSAQAAIKRLENL